MQYCSLQHWALLSPPVTSTTGCHFCFGSGPSFLLELFPHSFSSSILGTYQTGFSSFHVISFFPFHTIHVVLKIRVLRWFAIPFSSGPRFLRILHHDPNHLSVTLHGMPHSFIKLHKVVIHVIILASSL